jgi:hypothetical protein
MPPEQQVLLMSPLGLVFTLSLALLILFFPRRFVLLPIAIATCYMTFGQQVVVAGLHFTILRLLVLVGCCRIIFKREFSSSKWQRIDTFMLLWVLTGVTTYTLLWQTSAALVNRLGFSYDAIGLYFIFRVLIRNLPDIERVARTFALLLFPLALCMCIEKATGKNPFYVFGGVPEFTQIREGVLRCQGPFLHPILAGTFGAVWIPLCVGLLWQGNRNRFFAIIGIVSSTLITLLAGSSGPVATYFAGILACGMWPLRLHMRRVRWGVVGILIVLQIAMNNPIWFIFARVNLFSGSTGWHRSNLIDRTISNVLDWWLIGTKDTFKWGVWAGDITNQFILEGVRGGVVVLALFIYVIVLAFSGVGRAMKGKAGGSRRSKLLLWAVGATLFAHIISFLGISYFDQNVVNWYLCLSMAAAAVNVSRRRREQSIKIMSSKFADSIGAEPQTAHPVNIR